VTVTKKSYRWAAPGDVNAFFGLMLDNIADLLLTVSLLVGGFGLSADFAFQHLIPGTAVGVLVGDLLFFWLALRLARDSGRNDITAMPLGLDTPSTFGMVFFVLGPALVAGKAAGLSPDAAAVQMWHIGICSIFISGLFKFACAFGSNWVRRVVPRAGLLGSLAAVALVLISFLPLVEMLQAPVVALVALAIILTTLVARVPLPLKIPGALGALLVAGGMYWLMALLDYQFGWHLLPQMHREVQDPSQALLPRGWLTVFTFEWVGAFPATLQYLPIVIPFALATVVGGIDCTESAAAAGDEFDTGQVIAVEACATVVAALCGGVIQTTPYIGHPAYKAMGGRAAYTLATGLFVGAAGLIGFFGYLYVVIPKPTVFPILIFIGLEITAQSFVATPRKHYAAIVLGCVPALAALALIYLNGFLGELARLGVSPDLLRADFRGQIDIVRILANGFIVTSLLWASLLAKLIDRRLTTASGIAALLAVLTLFGIVHSPLPGAPMLVPWPYPLPGREQLASWQLGPEFIRTPLEYAAGYLFVAILLYAWGKWADRQHQARPLDVE
jgi:AGZA family xanthine/uracil permease-like MFS transporter